MTSFSIFPLSPDAKIAELTGLYEAYQDSHAQIIIKAITECEIYNKIQILTFSDNEALKNGKNLTDYILKNNLGTIQETGPEKSLNTSSTINTRIWLLDKEAIKKWAENKPTIDTDNHTTRIYKKRHA